MDMPSTSNIGLAPPPSTLPVIAKPGSPDLSQKIAMADAALIHEAAQEEAQVQKRSAALSVGYQQHQQDLVDIYMNNDGQADQEPLSVYDWAASREALPVVQYKPAQAFYGATTAHAQNKTVNTYA